MLILLLMERNNEWLIYQVQNQILISLKQKYLYRRKQGRGLFQMLQHGIILEMDFLLLRPQMARQERGRAIRPRQAMEAL